MHNNIVIDHATRTAIDKTSGFDLLNPPPPRMPKISKLTLKKFFLQLKADRALMLSELKMVCAECWCILCNRIEEVKPVDAVAALKQHIEALTNQEQINCLGDAVKTKYTDIFSPIPHLDELPTDVYCRIITQKSRQNNCHLFIQHSPKVQRSLDHPEQHLDAGHIRPSNSVHASPAFLVPKTDTLVLPRWVNDFHALNSNTITDSHLLL